MVKKKSITKEPESEKYELVRTSEGKDVLATIKSPNNKDVLIKIDLIRSITAIPVPMVEVNQSKEQKMQNILKLKALGIASLSQSKEIQDEAINLILGDLVEGAYQDRIIAYSRTLTTNTEGSSKAYSGLQKIRQAADNHLLNIIKVIKDINQPVTKLTVKEAQQVNVAEKQVNISLKNDTQNTPNP